MTSSTHLKLPFILPSQAQKHITHNEAIAALDTLTQLAVLDRDLSAPPLSPAEGDRYIVGASASGDWAGKTNQIAAFDGAIWQFYPPEPGWTAYLVDEAQLVLWNATAWVPIIVTARTFGINTAADATNRLAVKSDAVLLCHDDVTPGSGDLRLKFNKLAAANTAALLFQSNWSGRAELGLTGDDKLHLKTSPDGSAWHEAIVADPATGNLGIGTASPTVALEVDGPVRVKSYSVATLPSAAAGAGQFIMVSDESGGPIPAFSDGTTWRRVTDRAVVS